MKKIIITLLITSTLFVACDNVDTNKVSKITNYPIITVSGDDPFFVPQGTPYTDPGAVALEGGVEIPVVTTAVGTYRGANTIDTNTPDEYKVTYTATNVDGFDGTASRTVIVYKTGDLVTSLEGVYTCTISRNGITPNANYQNIEYIYIWKNTDGTYGISDAFGGWYQYGRGLGLGYITAGGIINAVDIPNNVFTYPGNPLTNTGFGGTANITDVNVNPITKKIVITCPWVTGTSNFNFIATLTQVQL